MIQTFMLLFCSQSYSIKTPIKGYKYILPNGEYVFEMKNSSWAGSVGLVERNVKYT